MQNNGKSLIEELLVVPVRYVFFALFLWLCLIAGLVYLMITI